MASVKQIANHRKHHIQQCWTTLWPHTHLASVHVGLIIHDLKVHVSPYLMWNMCPAMGNMALKQMSGTVTCMAGMQISDPNPESTPFLHGMWPHMQHLRRLRMGVHDFAFPAVRVGTHASV